MRNPGENMKSKKSVKGKLPKIKPDRPYPLGKNPERDAWYTAFFIENHLDYFSHPEHASTPEQVRFMVYTEEDERYYPCSDQMFAAIINRHESRSLQEQYRANYDPFAARKTSDHHFSEPHPDRRSLFRREGHPQPAHQQGVGFS
jgi:hypothetical protein